MVKLECVNCGNKLTGKENFCRICGTSVINDNDKKVISVNKKSNSQTKNGSNVNDKKVELTGNIDVTKIQIIDHSEDNIDDVSGDEIKVTRESADKEFKAMLEITSIENQPKINPDDTSSLMTGNVDKNIVEEETSDVVKFKSNDNDMKIDIMPGEVSALEIQSTSELEELISDNVQNAKSNSNEQNNTVSSIINQDDMNESTMFIPDELISNKNISVKEEVETSKTLELDEITSPLFLSKNSDTIEKNEYDRNSEVLIKQTVTDDKLMENVNLINSNEVASASLKEKESLSIESSGESVLEPNVNFSANTDTNNNESLPETLKPKKGGKFSIVILTVLLVVCALCLGYLIYQLVILTEDFNELQNDNKLLTDKISIIEKQNKQSEQINKKVNELKINGYKIELDSSNEYAIEDNSLLIKNNKNNIIVNFGVNVDYESIKEKEGRESYKEFLIEHDYDIQSYGTKYSDEREYVVYEVTNNENKKSLIAYTTLSDNDTIGFIISNLDNQIDYDSLKITNKVVESLTYDYEIDDKKYDLFINEENRS